MKLKEILNMNFETKIMTSVQKNLADIKLFFVAFAINIIIYGQKIFFYSIAIDDYSRFYLHSRDNMFLIKDAGRWAQQLLNDYVFVGGLHVLPYFHGVIGVLAFTLVGFLTAKYLKRTNSLEILIITLLISASPMFAENLHFNTNITAWITTALAVIGFLMFHKPNIFTKVTGFIFLVIAIGNYQTIIQVIAAMIILKSMFDLLEAENTKEIKKIFFNALWLILFVILAYAASVGINEYIVYHYDLTANYKYIKVLKSDSLWVYIDRIMQMYTSTVSLQYFNTQLSTLYSMIGILGIFAALLAVVKRKINKSIKIISFVLIVLLLLSLPMIINLPLISGNSVPTRAHYTIGWILAGLFAIQMFSFRGILKTFSILLALSIIIVSTYYINIFFDAASRQTDFVITRANQIVTRIRADKNYITEPMKFKIVGKRAFTVLGWRRNWDALTVDWTRYKVFKYFTDFKYSVVKERKNIDSGLNEIGMTDNDYNEVKEYLIKEGEIIDAYPGKNSIVVYNNKAVVFLDSSTINAEIIFPTLQNKEPDIKSDFNIWIKDKIIYYKKSPCTKEDTKHWFYLQIHPADKTVLSKAKQKRGYAKTGFYFSSYGDINDNTCIVTRELPAYDILKLRTGQYHDSKRDWDVTYSFEQNKTY